MGIEPVNPFELPLLNTVILLSSGATITYAHHALIKGERKGAIYGSIFTVLLALIFTVFQGIEYSVSSFTISDGVFGTCFFFDHHHLGYEAGLFASISVYLILSGLTFIGFSYLIVYIGAVSILFLFILMLINIRTSELQSNNVNSIPLALFIGSYNYNNVLPAANNIDTSNIMFVTNLDNSHANSEGTSYILNKYKDGKILSYINNHQNLDKFINEIHGATNQNIHKEIFNSIQYKNIEGGLQKTSLNSTLFRGNVNPNISYSIANDTRRVGSFAIRG
ncbi:hypothetical protein RirG_049640 [Rhizophagus irregularis DAOM 197198w]|uniref:Cytochrome c oxidase subunit 3 n=1 Tax=Rhizophagus irregularis (strain DAOM 197198w) TaxID=1432141 RepID=A0A015L4E3_RHIIW|nr:hypothetical protein RirG_049640 [Rhizophagus irregularis DAOM 197198w]